MGPFFPVADVLFYGSVLACQTWASLKGQTQVFPCHSCGYRYNQEARLSTMSVYQEVLD